jgi:diaminohydroxyphosphoribosylaminopyrimidine deaminase/5-amino-6-(5-phosphoribosylamino)uracil reductase
MDAILVGRGTVAADDPLLTARPPGPRTPARVVVTSSGNLPERCRLRETARESPVIIYTSPASEAKLADWSSAGAEVVAAECVEAVLDDLGKRRFTNLLVEGGAGLLGSILDAGVVDEFHVYVAPKLAGGRGPSPVAGDGIERMADAMRLVEFSAASSGEDVYLHGFSRGALPD